MKESRYNVWVHRGRASYVYNGLSGALLRVPEADHELLRRFLAAGEEAGDCRPALLLELAKGRMLVPDELDEVALLAARYRSSQSGASHFGLTIVTSLGCNFACPYCFEAKHASIMSEEVQQAVLQVLDDKLPSLKSFGVAWFGGEPLIGKRSLLALSDAFIERCERRGVEYIAEITTNGYLLDEETCAELRDRRIVSVQICLDGPPVTHDRMRPLAGGKGTFWRIVRNLRHAVEYLAVSIRMNADRGNVGQAEELLRLLADEGFAGKLCVHLGQIVGVSDGAPSPSATYRGRCLPNREFAQAQEAFDRLAGRYGFATLPLPSFTGAPCTAVRANELVVGSEGELYKCWESVGNPREVVGDIRSYREGNERLRKWLTYDPFSEPECRSCVALPVCMGGCAHHGLDPRMFDDRCVPFRHTYRQQLVRFIDSAEHVPSSALVAVEQAAHRMETR